MGRARQSESLNSAEGYNESRENIINSKFEILEKKLLETKNTAESVTEPQTIIKFTG